MSRLVRTLTLALLLVGCNEEPAPVTTAKAFLEAVRSNNIEDLLELVDARTVAALEESAERASDQIGGRRSVGPEEMLQVVDIERRFMVKKAEVVTQTDTNAQVRLIGVDGTEHVIDLVLEDSGWRVRLELPPSATES